MEKGIPVVREGMKGTKACNRRPRINLVFFFGRIVGRGGGVFGVADKRAAKR